jgi:TldD protein
MTLPISSLIDRAGLERTRLNKIVAHGLAGADDGEFYLEYRQSEMLVFDNGRLKQATYDTSQGFGLRAVKDEAVGYAHASDVSDDAIVRAAEAVRAVKGGYSGVTAQAPGRTNRRLYADDNPLGAPAFDAKVKLLEEINDYARRKDPRVRQVTVSLGASWQVVEILRADGEIYRDVRPLVSINVWSSPATANVKSPAATAMGDARAMSASSRPAPGRARSTTRCARHWSISTPCRLRLARWTWCWAPAGPA